MIIAIKESLEFSPGPSFLHGPGKKKKTPNVKILDPVFSIDVVKGCPLAQSDANKSISINVA